jgi:hypothetical protein
VPDQDASDLAHRLPRPGLEAEVVRLIEVRNACLAARGDAQIAASDTDSPDSYLRYAAARDRCIELARSISDDFYRDTAFHWIYDLCKRAHDNSGAQLALRQIKSDVIRGNIVDGRPALFD